MRISIVIIATIILCLIPGAVFGQISVTGTMTHVYQSESAAEYSGTIVVQNSGNEAQAVRVLQTDYQFSADGRVFYDPPGSHTRSNAEWITPSARMVRVPARSETTISYVIRTPSASLHGTYWSVIIVESDLFAGGALDAGSTGLRHVMRFAIQIVSQFSGGVEGLTVTAAQLTPSEDGPMLSLDVANTGTLMLRPDVTLELYARDGESSEPIVAEPKRLYPGSSLRFALPLRNLAPGEYRALAVIDSGGDDVYAVQYALEL